MKKRSQSSTSSAGPSPAKQPRRHFEFAPELAPAEASAVVETSAVAAESTPVAPTVSVSAVVAICDAVAAAGAAAYAAARAAERAEEEATELWQLMFDYRTRMRPTVETIRDIIRK